MESRFRSRSSTRIPANVVPPPYGPTQRAALTDNTANGADNLSGKLNKIHFRPALGCLILALPTAIGIALYIKSMSP